MGCKVFAAGLEEAAADDARMQFHLLEQRIKGIIAGMFFSTYGA